MYNAVSGPKGPDRWYYNATISNPQTGDTDPVIGRFSEQRTVPLMTSCAGYYVALARLSIIGSTGNLPILIPPVSQLTNDGIIHTDYYVSVRWTFRTSTGVAYAYADSGPVALDIPSKYADQSGLAAEGPYYWVDSADSIVTALNVAISQAAKQVNLPINVVGTGPALGPTTGATPVYTNSTFYHGSTTTGRDTTVMWYATLDKDSYKIYLHAFGENDGATLPGTPSELPRPTPLSPGGSTQVTADLFFSDKLLELFPMETMAPYRTATAAYWTVPLNRAPWVDYYQYPVGTLSSPRAIPMYPLALARANADDVVEQPTTGMNFLFGTSSTVEFVWAQEYESTSAWSPFTGLAITSSTIPAETEAVGINLSDSYSIQPSGKATANIIFDIDLAQSTIHQLQQGVAFAPNTYRYAKLNDAPLYGVDFDLLLRTRSGLYVPWYITNGGSVSAKFMFLRNPY